MRALEKACQEAAEAILAADALPLDVRALKLTSTVHRGGPPTPLAAASPLSHLCPSAGPLYNGVFTTAAFPAVEPTRSNGHDVRARITLSLTACLVLALAAGAGEPPVPKRFAPFDRGLDLPDNPVSRRLSRNVNVGGPETVVLGELAGPGCIRRIWMAGKGLGTTGKFATSGRFPRRGRQENPMV